MKKLLAVLRVYGVSKFFLFILSELHQRVWNRYVYQSYSQHGEDMIIDKLLGYKKKGVYVDIGAYDPKRFSNTMRFYKRGWSGINIEPNKSKWQNFMRCRPNDINLNVGIGLRNNKTPFYQMQPGTLSTFSKQQAQRYIRQGFALEQKTLVRTIQLSTVLHMHANNRKIDFISIDVEGYELEVLKGNNWKRFRPLIICIESETTDNKNNNRRKIYRYMKSISYKKVFDNGLNVFYQDVCKSIKP